MRKKVLAVIMAVLAFSLIAASAASLGGITVNGEIGADAELVGSCDTDGVAVDFDTPTYNDATGDYEVEGLTVSGIDDDCDGSDLQITLTTGAGTVLATSGTFVVGLNGAPDNNFVDVSGFAADAEAIGRVVVAITG